MEIQIRYVGPLSLKSPTKPPKGNEFVKSVGSLLYFLLSLVFKTRNNT